MKNKFLTIIFLVVIFGVFLFVPAKEVLIRLHKVSFYRSDNWKLVDKTNDKIYDKIMSLESFIENRYNNYFPLYNKINDTYYNSIIKIDSMYLDDVYLKENNDQDRVFYNKDKNFYYLVNRYSKDELEDRYNNLANFYNGIKEKYPDIELALYMPLRYEFTSFKNINGTNDLVNDFIASLDDDILYDTLDSKDVSEYLTNFYKTDHHYNAIGALKSYKKILELFRLHDNNVYALKLVKTPYYGSMAKSLLTAKVSDKLMAIDYPNNLVVNIEDSKFKPLEIKDSSNKFYDYYVAYFNGQYDEIIYENDRVTNKNLLIIGDSMSWQIDYLLASNFDKTYVVNVRYGKWKNNDLDLDSYIKENNITHILFLMEAKNLIFDMDNFNIDKKVVY